MTRTETSPEQRRRNLRLAWILAGFALLMLVSSIPFWRGLFNMITNSVQ